MWQRTLIAVMVLGLLLMACTTNKDSSDNTTADPPASETDTGPDADSVSDETNADTDETTSADTDDAGTGATGLLSNVNPFELLNVLGTTGSADVDPVLKQSLLDSGDLPPDFIPLGEFSFSTPSEYGDMDMVATMFTNGDISSTELGAFSMVMSAAILLPPEALEELGNIDDLESMIGGEFDAFEAEIGEFGEFADFEVLDASGLGDGGFGMHIEMDFGGLFAGFGVPEGELDAAGIAMDMYVFFQGEQMLMLMTMSPTDQPLGVDAYELAQLMADK